MDKKTEFGQYLATGEHDPGDHAKNPIAEAQAHGDGGSLVADTSIKSMNEGVQAAPPVGN